jgi:GNAT superfamily N-acetyltransferase
MIPQGMSDLIIRPASSGDAAALVELIGALGYSATAIEMRRRVAALVHRADYVTLVACEGEKVVGLAGAFLHLAIEHDRPFARLTGLVVHESWRRRGIGALLMKRLEEWSRQQGAMAITLTSGNHRREAHDFYRHIGYQETGVRFMKSLA